MNKPKRKSPIYFIMMAIGIACIIAYSSYVDSQERESGKQAMILKAIPYTTMLNIGAGILSILFTLIIYAIKISEDEKILRYAKKHVKKKKLS